MKNNWETVPGYPETTIIKGERTISPPDKEGIKGSLGWS